MPIKKGDSVIYQTQAGDPSSHRIRSPLETYECMPAVVVSIDTENPRQPATLKVVVDGNLAPVEFGAHGPSFEIANIPHGTAPGQWRTLAEAKADWGGK